VKIRTLIVDDEPLARKRIIQLLANEKEFEVIGESGSVAQSVFVFEELKPDLIFLDIEMPDGSGFDFLALLSPESIPAVVFVTAYDQFTIKAFDFHAVDYLLKPFSEERFQKAAGKVRERLIDGSGKDLNQQIRTLLAHVKTNHNYLERLIINHNNRLIVIPTADVDWIAAFGNYLRVHSKEKTYLLRATISHLAGRLNPENFVRIHRSTVVNVERIKELRPMFGGQYAVILNDETEFVLSRNYRKEVLERFNA
jgi:two-component system, LytTR family, response regulator